MFTLCPSGQSVDFMSTTVHLLFHTIMFVSVSDIKSSSIASLKVNGGKNQAIVKYVGSDQSYLYNNVDFGALATLFTANIKSIGQWVNINLKNAEGVTCTAV